MCVTFVTFVKCVCVAFVAVAGRCYTYTVCTYLLAYLDEEARDHAVQQHVGEEAAAHLRGHSHAGPNARGWFAHPVRTVRGALGPSRPVPLRYVNNPAGWYA